MDSDLLIFSICQRVMFAVLIRSVRVRKLYSTLLYFCVYRTAFLCYSVLQYYNIISCQACQFQFCRALNFNKRKYLHVIFGKGVQHDRSPLTILSISENWNLMQDGSDDLDSRATKIIKMINS